MKKVLVLLGLMFLTTTILAQDSSNDTLTVESKGYGSSKKEAVKDAIRNAAESSVGVLITSNTLIENYVTIKDQILTSANAYVYRYEEKQNGYDKNTGIYSVTIKAFVSKKLLLKNTNAKINQNLKLDMTPIEKTKFEMEQSRERAVSAITYLGAFVQKHFRDTYVVSADSLTLANKDVMKMTADVKVYGTVNIKNKNEFIFNYLKLSERVKEYIGKQVDLEVNFDLILSVKNSEYYKEKSRYESSIYHNNKFGDDYHKFHTHLLLEFENLSNVDDIELRDPYKMELKFVNFPFIFFISLGNKISLNDLGKIDIAINYSADLIVGDNEPIPLFKDNKDINLTKIKL